MPESELLFTRPRLLNKVYVLVETLSKLILYCELILVRDWAQDEGLVFKLLNVSVPDKFNFEVARVVLLIVFMHSIVDKRFHFQWLLDPL